MRPVVARHPTRNRQVAFYLKIGAFHHTANDQVAPGVNFKSVLHVAMHHHGAEEVDIAHGHVHVAANLINRLYGYSSIFQHYMAVFVGVKLIGVIHARQNALAKGKHNVFRGIGRDIPSRNSSARFTQHRGGYPNQQVALFDVVDFPAGLVIHPAFLIFG